MKVTTVVNIKHHDFDVYIGRGNCPKTGIKSKWGCPFTIIKNKPTLAQEIVSSKEEALTKYREYVLNSPNLLDSLDELEGKVLGCFCKPEKCHGDVLLALLSEKKLKTILNK